MFIKLCTIIIKKVFGLFSLQLVLCFSNRTGLIEGPIIAATESSAKLSCYELKTKAVLHQINNNLLLSE